MAIASGALAAPRTISNRRMTLAGLKKCVPTTSWGRAVAPAISSTSRVEVLVASNAPGFRRAVEIGEDAFLEPHLLEHRLDDDIGLRDGVDTDGAGDQAQAALHLVGASPPRATVAR